MIWDGQQEREKELHWGLPSRDPDIFQIPLLKSETAIIDRPCLLLANAFGLVKRGKTVYSASLIGEPFLCIAATWRPGNRDCDRKSTLCTPVTNAHLVCRLRLEK